MTPEIIAYIDRSGNLRPGDCPLRSDLEPLVRLSDVIAYFEKVARETEDQSKFGKSFWSRAAAQAMIDALPVGEAQDSDMGAFDALKEQA